MGEDAQLEASDEEYLLSPADDETLNHNGLDDKWICSIDGSYAIDRRKLRYGQDEFLPWSGLSPKQQLVMSTVSEGCSFSGVELDDNQPQPPHNTRSSRMLKHDSRSSYASHSSQTDGKRSQLRAESLEDYQKHQRKIREYFSPIYSAVSGTRSEKIYDPLRKIASYSFADDGLFSSELQDQGEKLMNGLETILRERLFQKNPHRPLSSCANTIATTLSRVGSVSTVSTGRDALSKEVKRLENAFADIDLDFGTGGIYAGGESSSSSRTKRGYTTRNNSGLQDVLGKELPESVSNGTSTVEEARQGSGCSVHILTENAIRDAEDSSKLLGRLDGVASHKLSSKVLREQSTNTSRAPIRQFVVTHHVRHDVGYCIGNRAHSELHLCKPPYHTFQLKSSLADNGRVSDVNSISHDSERLHKRGSDCCGESGQSITSRNAADKSTCHVQNLCRKSGGGKRGRPIATRRTLYGRGRVHFRPMHRYNDSTKRKETMKHDAVQDAATSTDQKDEQLNEEDNPKAVAESTIDSNGPKLLATIKSNKNSAIHQKMPFVGSGLKCFNTFSVAGNQQQVLKIVSVRFQEWLPLVRSIIYDSQCKDYAHALLRDLSRHKRSNLEQIQVLERDLKKCRDDCEKRDINSDITRLRQQWSRKHEQVLKCLSELISRGGVDSKVQQLRTIYVACAS